VKTLAFVIGCLIGAVGVVGILAPAGFVWIARHAVTAGALYGIATVRVAVGLVLIAVASGSRAPKTLRVLGYLLLIAGITTALTALVAIECARALIAWWVRQGPTVIRLTGIPLLALGGVIAYACAPARRGA